MELLGRLGTLGHIAGAGGDPLLEVLVMDQLLYGLIFKLAETGFPQVMDGEGVGSIGEQDVGSFHRTQQRRGEHGVHLRILEPLLQLVQLGAALVAQGQVGAAADVQALQVAGGHAMADEMKLECFHGKDLFGSESGCGAAAGAENPAENRTACQIFSVSAAAVRPQNVCVNTSSLT